MTDTSRWVLANGTWDNSPAVLDVWREDANLAGFLRPADDFRGVVAALRGLPPAEVARMQAALANERGKVLFSAPEGEEGSQLGRIIVRRMCEYAARARAPKEGDGGGTA